MLAAIKALDWAMHEGAKGYDHKHQIKHAFEIEAAGAFHTVDFLNLLSLVNKLPTANSMFQVSLYSLALTWR
jgi:hypothetical protein